MVKLSHLVEKDVKIVGTEQSPVGKTRSRKGEEAKQTKLKYN